MQAPLCINLHEEFLYLCELKFYKIEYGKPYFGKAGRC